MINDKKFEQKSGDDSTNYQAQEITIIKEGMSYSECKEVALDVYKANYLQLSNDAAQIAFQRAEHLIDSLLEKLRQENEKDLNAFNDPGMQTAIYDAQKAFIRSGDEDLEAVLVELLKERMRTEQRDLKQIILDEALKVSESLTSQQMDILSLVFVITKTCQNGLGNLDKFYNYLETSVKPLTSNLTKSQFCYQHMKYTGCCSLFEASNLKPIEDMYRQVYPAMFQKGFALEDIKLKSDNLTKVFELLLMCFHYPNLYQFNAYNTDELEQKCQALGVTEDEIPTVISLFNSSLMSQNEIKEHLEEKFDFMKNLIDVWSNSSLNTVSLSSVGIAIGQINYKLKTGKDLDVNIWLQPKEE
ncbi:LPO_1073/Vpar_1526 family protein [Vibrio campbellii]